MKRGLCWAQRLFSISFALFSSSWYPELLQKDICSLEMGKEPQCPGQIFLCCCPFLTLDFPERGPSRAFAPNPSPPGRSTLCVCPVEHTSFSWTQPSSAIFAGPLTICHLWNVMALTFWYVWGASVDCRRLQKDVHFIGKDRMIDTRLAFCQSSSLSLRGETVLLNATRSQHICHVGAFQPTVKDS